MLNRLFRKKETRWKGLAIGLAGGLAATVVMTQFQNAWGKIAKLNSSREDSSSSKNSDSESAVSQAEEKENATEKAASKLADIAGYQLTRSDEKKAGTLVHYGFGTVMGGVYSLGMAISNNRLRRISPLIPGALFGAGLFLAADELAVPALRLSGKPSESDLGTHLYGLASHLVYGLTLGGVRSLTRRLL